MHRTVKLILFSCLLLSAHLDFALAQNSAQQSDEAVIKVNPASKARIDIVSDNYDFGSIPRGAIVVHSFVVKNAGQDTLSITNVKPTCGCTTAPLTDSLVAPGEQTDIKATFNTQKFNGRVKKQIYVDSSDPIKPYLKVSFSAIINNPLQTIVSEPSEADFGLVKAGKSSELKVKITNNDSIAANLAIVEESAPAIVTAGLAKTTIKPGGSTELTLKLQPQDKAETITQSITLEAGNIADSRFTIPWKAVIVQ
jgi:P pilus assembly chaperone PapD